MSGMDQEQVSVEEGSRCEASILGAGDCGNEATTHVTLTIDGEDRDAFLCDEHAATVEQAPPEAGLDESPDTGDQDPATTSGAGSPADTPQPPQDAPQPAPGSDDKVDLHEAARDAAATAGVEYSDDRGEHFGGEQPA